MLEIGQKVNMSVGGDTGTGVIKSIVPVEEHTPEDLETKSVLFLITVETGNFDIHRRKDDGELPVWDFELEKI